MTSGLVNTLPAKLLPSVLAHECGHIACKYSLYHSIAVQLIHEKMLLSEAKAVLFLKQLQEFKMQLDLKVSNYLAEDIEGFMAGFDDMRQGLSGGDSGLVVRGSVTIQKVLGREPQFTNQKEFDALMESDAPLVL